MTIEMLSKQADRPLTDANSSKNLIPLFTNQQLLIRYWACLSAQGIGTPELIPYLKKVAANPNEDSGVIDASKEAIDHIRDRSQ